MKTVVIMLKDHPKDCVEMYVSRRSKFVHMGLDVPLSKIDTSELFVRDSENFWNKKKTDDKFKFVEPYLTNCTRYKYDYIIFEKNY